MFGNSFIVGMVIKFIANKGMEFIEAFSAEHKAQVEAWVKDLVKPDALDEPIWKAVDVCWSALLEGAKLLVGRLAEGINHDKALAEAVAHAKPAVVAALEAQKVA